MWNVKIRNNLLITVIILLAASHGAAKHKHRVKRIVGGRQAAQPPVDDPVVFARAYSRDARVEGYRNTVTKVYSFLGLRYADPPIGQNRYTRPRFRRLEGDINATVHGPPCPQPDPQNPQRVVGNEDCLLLNIFTPQMPDETTGLPVYVWIHPGGFRYGSAAQYDAQPLAQQGMIFVPVQYRLGSLGIIGDGTKEFNGNLAMFDMATALRWVTEYISFFGGDPKQMKVIGHGSGAASAMYLSMSRLPRSGSTITGVVAMSGSALSQYATDEEPVQSLEEMAAINDCPTTNETEIVKCLRGKSVDDIISRDSEIETERLQGRAMIKGLAGSVGFNPHVEEPDDKRALPSLLIGKPNETIKEGNFSATPLLTGVTKHETGNAVSLNTLNQIWGSAEKFLNSLTESLNSLTGLLRIDQATGSIAKPNLPGLTGNLAPSLNDFLKVPDTLNVNEVISKVIEATTDALFNLPAVLSAQFWSQSAPAFMYSFEHKGTVSKGINFLRGLPLVTEQNNNSELVAHGDELGYMFDANDLFGNPLLEAKIQSSDDIKVRKSFIGLLKKFAIGVSNKEGRSDNGGFPSITSKGTPFIKVDTELEFLDDFRFCELSLWGASLAPLASTTCQGLTSALNPATNILSNVGSGIGGTLGGANRPPTPASNSKNRGGNRVGGLLGGGSGGNGLLG